ncbi:hypothetical protein BDU57DRAFT_514018 [Ampelomyces quisqualis]|uniref:Uncharacterized protein n=1 Tax=Ampelomyces quisqualis TaxID=50730 RepID=A0A6A5QQJ3_AMPQU|nr:hypothetical protein BDU57DRAFT_514018 [Ampelomyces quisqualis]
MSDLSATVARPVAVHSWWLCTVGGCAGRPPPREIGKQSGPSRRHTCIRKYVLQPASNNSKCIMSQIKLTAAIVFKHVQLHRSSPEHAVDSRAIGLCRLSSLIMVAQSCDRFKVAMSVSSKQLHVCVEAGHNTSNSRGWGVGAAG